MGDPFGHGAAWWLIGAAVLGAAELFVPGLFLVFAAAAAAIVGAFLLLFPDIPVPLQLLSFAVWTGVAVGIGRRWYHDYPVATADPLLNDRAARLIGETVVVSQAIQGGRGRVRLGDGEWIALGPDAPDGAVMRVIGTDQAALRVAPPDAEV